MLQGEKELREKLGQELIFVPAVQAVKEVLT